MENKKNKSEVVRQSNVLTTASYRLGRKAKKVLYLSLGILSDRGSLKYCPENEGYVVEINYSKYKDSFSVSDNDYRDIKEACKELKTQEITIRKPENDDGKNKGISGVSWINKYDLSPRSSMVTLYFNKSVAESIYYRFGDPYTKYLLYHASSLESPYAMRLYELICQWRESRSEIKLEIEWVIKNFGMPKSMNRMPVFRNSFLINCVNQINENTDITITETEEVFLPKCRKPTYVILRWRDKLAKKKKVEVKKTIEMTRKEKEEKSVEVFYRLEKSKDLDLITPDDIKIFMDEMISLVRQGFNISEVSENLALVIKIHDEIIGSN